MPPKFDPEIVTDAPTAPVVVESPEIEGVPSTEKLMPFVSTPLAWTTTFPVVAPAGTVTPIDVEVQLDTDATVPLNFTVPEP